jgi:hypothetical protein
MGVQINGTNDTISDSDSGFSLGGTNNRLRLYGATSGYVEIDAPAAAGSNTLTLPTGNGSSGQYLQTNGSGALSWQTVDTGANWTDASSVTTSGSSSYTFTLPTDVNIKQVIMTWFDVSWSSTTLPFWRVGTTTDFTSSVYHRGYSQLRNGALSSASTGTASSWDIGLWNSSSHFISGTIRIINISGTAWVMNGWFSTTEFNEQTIINGDVNLGGTLGRFTMGVSAGTFDGGTANVHYITA